MDGLEPGIVVSRLVRLCLIGTLLVGCGSADDPDEIDELVIPIDRTGSVHDESWQAEVAAQTQAALEAAMADGADHVDLIGIGSNTDQVATIAEADLDDIEGNTEAKRNDARRRLVEALSSAAAQAAGQPVETYGSDLFSALEQAASLCHAPEVTRCSIVLLSDMEDQRVTGAPSAEAAIQELSGLMPDLTGIRVQVSGLGASGADAATVQKVQAAWAGLLEQAGAVDVRIARSL